MKAIIDRAVVLLDRDSSDDEVDDMNEIVFGSENDDEKNDESPASPTNTKKIKLEKFGHIKKSIHTL